MPFNDGSYIKLICDECGDDELILSYNPRSYRILARQKGWFFVRTKTDRKDRPYPVICRRCQRLGIKPEMKKIEE